MRDAVICEPIRTPVGGYGGTLKDVPAAELAAIVVKELVRRCGVKSEHIDDVIFGQVYPNSEAPAIGRIAALDWGSMFQCQACSWTGGAGRAYRR